MAKRRKKRSPEQPTPKEIRRQRKTRQENRTLLIAAGAVIAVIVLVLGFGFYQENFAAPRAPVAVVNGQAISTQSYQDLVSYQRFNLLRTFGNQLDQQTLVNYLQNQLPQAALDSLIDQALIDQTAAEAGITVTDEEVQAEIEQQLGFTGDEPAATVSAGEAVTTTTSTGSITREEFDEAFQSLLDTLSTQGVSEAEYRKIIRDQLLRDKVLERVTEDVSRTAEQVHARHILVETEEEAQAVRQRLLDGEDFATVAEEVSTDTASAAESGDLGWFGRGDMVPEFEEAAFSLPPGEISEPVESQFGFHIIEVIERDENRQLTESQFEQTRQERFNQWLQEQRAAAEIQRSLTPDVVPTLPAALAGSGAQPTPPPPQPTPSHTPAP